MQRGGEVEFLHKIQGFLQGGAALVLGGIGLIGPDEDIFGRMGQIDKLQKGCLVADALQQAAPDGVGHEGGGALLDDAVAGQGRQAWGRHLAV